jgi:hypothetical protein
LREKEGGDSLENGWLLVSPSFCSIWAKKMGHRVENLLEGGGNGLQEKMSAEEHYTLMPLQNWAPQRRRRRSQQAKPCEKNV